MDLGKYAKTVEKLVIDNSPAIMTGVGIVGTAVTAWLSHKAAVKSTVDILEHDSARRMKGEESLDKMERVKLTWVNYLPPVGAGAVTILSIYGANRVSTKRMAALAAGYSLLDNRFDEYKRKMTDKLGITKEEKARDEIAQAHVDKSPPPSTIIIAEDKVMFRDEPSGRYFASTMQAIETAVNEINRKIMKDEYAVLTDFYEAIGLPPTSLSEEYGWDISNSQMEVDYSSVIYNGKPVITMDYNVHPIRNGYSGGGGATRIRAV